MTDSRIKIPLSQISANYYDEQNTALNLRKTVLCILKRTWFSGAGGGFIQPNYTNLKQEQKEMFYLFRI